jgi:hypothetical protein
MKCLKCGKNNSDDHKFCAECGAELVPMECQECGNPLTSEGKFCGKCGTPNPFYVAEAVKQAKPRPTMAMPSFAGLRQYAFWIWTVGAMVLFVIALGVSFGGISRTHTAEWELDDGDWTYVDFSFVQSAMTMYEGYFRNLGVNDEDDLDALFEEWTDEYDENLEEYGDVLTSSEYAKVYRNTNVFGVFMLMRSNVERPFLNTLEYALVIGLLVLVQLMPLIGIGLLVYAILRRQESKWVPAVFYLGGVLSIWLALALPNLNNATSAGGGLIFYGILMWGGATVFTLRRLLDIKPDARGWMGYGLRVAIAVVLLLFATSSILRVGYETGSRTTWARMDVGEVTAMWNVFDTDMEYLDPETANLGWDEPMLEDEDLTSADQRHLVETTDYAYLFFYELFDSETGQNTRVILISVGVGMMVLFSSLLLVVEATDQQGERPRLSFVIKAMLAFSFLLVTILAMSFRSGIHQLFQQEDSDFLVRIGFGLVIGFFLTIGSVVFDVLRFPAAARPTEALEPTE